MFFLRRFCRPRRYYAGYAWAKAAEAVLAIAADVMVDMKTYTDDPIRILAWRDWMADLLEAEPQRVRV